MAMIEGKHRATSDPEARKEVLKRDGEAEGSSTSSSGSPTSRGT